MAVVVLIAACTKKTPTAPGEMGQFQAELIDAGRKTYLANCTACHNADTKKDGPLGPAVHGSSLELITTRVLDASYPAGYKPKRDSKVMAKLPHLKADLPALHAYLNN